MDNGNGYTDNLRTVLQAKIEHMDRVELKQLKDDFKLFQSAFQGLYGVLLKKGLIHEDPYKYELKISEVTIPPESPFSESEKLDQMSIRLSQYESYLDFLNNYYQFSVEFLSMNRIKRLVQLARYFSFTQFTANSQHINTRYFAEIIDLVRKGSDPLSTGIINEGLLQLDKASRKIFQTLKTLTSIHKESYKLQLRQAVLSGLALERDYVVTHEDDVQRKIRQAIADKGGALPFYPELISEVLHEDHSAEGQSLRDEVLKRLEVAAEAGAKDTAEKNYKAVILEGARVIIGVGFSLEDAVRKLEENQALVDAQDKSFMTKVKRALREMFGKKTEHVVHEVDFIDPVSSERKNESIDFTAFCMEAGKRAQALVGMASRASAAYKRLESSTEEQAYKFLAKSVEELQNSHRKMAALDEFFAGAVTDPEFKGRVRGIKIELGTIKNAIIKANQKRHEYIAQKEEQEQMKRLGIREA